MSLYQRFKFSARVSDQQTLQPELFHDEQTFLIEADALFQEATWKLVEVATAEGFIIDVTAELGTGRFIYFEASQDFQLQINLGSTIDVKVLPGTNEKAIFMASVEATNIVFSNAGSLTSTVKYLVIGA